MKIHTMCCGLGPQTAGCLWKNLQISSWRKGKVVPIQKLSRFLAATLSHLWPFKPLGPDLENGFPKWWKF
jgi:hypothetical protein